MSASPFAVHWALRAARELPPGGRRALDVAMGRGRHYRALADAGFRVFGVDRSFADLREAAAAARTEGGLLRAWCADLTAYPLPEAAFDLVLVTRYLQRELFMALKATLVPRGILIYETFTVEQRQLGWGPRSPEHLLEHGELLTNFSDFDVLFHEERDEPEAVERLVARRVS